MHARDIVFCLGDILYDETLQDVGVLIEYFPNGDMNQDVPVWRTYWIHAGEEYYSEFGLQNLVHLDVFVRFGINKL